MPLIKLITEVIPKKTQVLVTHSRAPLAVEIIRQLSDNPHIEVIACEDPSSSFTTPDSLGVIIHLPGFGPSSLAETLSHTSVLHHLLELSLSHRATFILVVPNTRHHLYHTAVTMVSQFGKNFPLSYQILEVDSHTPLINSASDVIRKFVYGHRVRQPSPPQDVQPPPPRPASLYRQSSYPGFHYLKKAVISLVLVFVAAWVIVALSSGSALASFLCSQSALSGSQFSLALRCAQTSQISSRLAVTVSPVALGSQSLILSLGFPYTETLSFLESYTRTLASLSQLATESHQVFQAVFTTGSSPSPKFFRLLPYLSQVTESLAQLQTDLRSFYSTSSRPPPQIFKLADKVQLLHGSVSKTQLLLTSIDQLLSSEKKPVIAVLLQDNTELRPTGGLIDTLIIFTLSQGRVASVQVASATASDQTLKGQAESPADYRAATGKSTWLMKDSNWDPDFPTTAKRVAWFIEKELSVSPDLVVSVNLSLVSDLLQILGPVSLDSPPATFDGPHFVSQYLDYLGSHPDQSSPLPEIAQILLTRFSQTSPRQIDQLNAAVLSALETGQASAASLSFTSPLNTINWGGGVSLPLCNASPPCFSDYVFPVISNTGANKADAQIVTGLHLDISVAPNRITKTISFQLRHRGQDSAWPSGPHQSYMRFYLPPSVQIDKVLLNGEALSRDRYTLSSDHGLLLVGLPSTTKASSTTKIELQTWQSLNFRGKLHYQLELPQQAGLLSSDPATISLSYPESWFVASYNLAAVASPGHLEYNTPSRGTFQLNLDLTPATAND